METLTEKRKRLTDEAMLCIKQIFERLAGVNKRLGNTSAPQKFEEL